MSKLTEQQIEDLKEDKDKRLFTRKAKEDLSRVFSAVSSDARRSMERELIEADSDITKHSLVMLLEKKDQLLKDIFTDITKDNRLSPDTFDKLIEVVKNG